MVGNWQGPVGFLALGYFGIYCKIALGQLLHQEKSPLGSIAVLSYGTNALYNGKWLLALLGTQHRGRLGASLSSPPSTPVQTFNPRTLVPLPKFTERGEKLKSGSQPTETLTKHGTTVSRMSTWSRVHRPRGTSRRVSSWQAGELACPTPRPPSPAAHCSRSLSCPASSCSTPPSPSTSLPKPPDPILNSWLCGILRG